VSSRLRRAALRFEALWWMTRIHLSNINMWPAVFGGVVAAHPLGVVAMIELVVYTASAGGALFIVNDILDAEGDRVTAPYLPLPSGLVGKRQAWAGAVGYFLVGVVALALACHTMAAFGEAAGLTLATVALSMVYSKVKDEGVVASLVISIPQTVPVVVGWRLAGGGRPWALVLVVVCHLVACVSNNILAALRDVDLDPVVGNRTLPVRIGAASAFRLAARTAYAAVAPILVLAVVVPGGWRGLPVAAAAVVALATSYRGTRATFTEPGRGRVQRMADMRSFKLGVYLLHVAVAACFSPLTALVAGALLYLMLRYGGRIYHRRVICGGLRRSLGLVPSIETKEVAV
jgi:4-hydroxybenzoate polyprenyltransferase